MNLILNFWHCGGCLSCTSARLRRADKHPPQTDQTQRTKPRNRLKSKAAAKIRRHAQAFRVRRIFLRRRDLLLFNGAFLSTVLFAPSFFVPFTFRNATAFLCAALLLCNTFVTVNCLSMPPQYFLRYGIIAIACKQRAKIFSNYFFEKRGLSPFSWLYSVGANFFVERP